MLRETNFVVRYDTEDTVPVRDIIESLQGIETIMGVYPLRIRESGNRDVIGFRRESARFF